MKTTSSIEKKAECLIENLRQPVQISLFSRYTDI